MDTVPALHSQRLRLKTSPRDLEASPCTRCHESHAVDRPCQKRQRIPQSPPALALSASDFSSYTARICPSTASLPRSPLSSSPVDSDSHSTLSSSFSTPSIKVRIPKHARPSAPKLRRKVSPTETSLRDIRTNQQRLQAQQSEDQLRQLYERQTMEYLYSDFASLDTLAG